VIVGKPAAHGLLVQLNRSGLIGGSNS
jgi:hypothetical protein